MKTSKKAKYPTMQIVKGVRQGKKVVQRTVAHLGVIRNKQDLQELKDLADKLVRRLEKEGLEVAPKAELKDLKHKKTVYDGFGIVVDRLMHRIGFDKIIGMAQGRRRFNLEEIIKLILVQRFELPSSKRRTFERQGEHGFSGIDLQHLYRAMDAIEPMAEAIQKKAFDAVVETSGSLVDCFFFDVTTLYFESIIQDDLRDFGFSKDQKHHMVQIVLALVVDSHGIPVAYEVFKGNLGETQTLIPVLERLKNRFPINHVTVVCDRGLASLSNVRALQKAHFHFVIAAKLKSMPKDLNINDLSRYETLPSQDAISDEERVLFRVMPHPQYADTELIITYSPHRARKDKEDRERLIEKLRCRLSNSSKELPIKKVISNGGYRKYTVAKEGAVLTLNEEAIMEDARWDGFHGIAVAKDSKLGVEQALSRYHDLWHVEEAFRVAKCTLKTRPIFHWTSHRIRTHVLLCFMNLFFERFLEWLLRKNDIRLTPDRIRHALSQVHTTIFEDESTSREGQMQSVLTPDAQQIFQVLGIPTERITTSNGRCCA